MKKLPFVLLALLFAQGLFAQKNLTYTSDRRFKDPTDLLGFNFRPAEKELKGASRDALAPGAVTFGITRQNLFVEGEGIKGVYNINNINPTEYGFKLLLLDARNPAEQGHLKVILNGRKEAQALVFKKSSKSPEVIFHLAELPDELGKREAKHFTDRNELWIENADSLWGKNVLPFLRLHQQSGIQERLVMADSMRFFFYETVEIIDKTKKKKEKEKASSKKAEAAQTVDAQPVAADAEAVAAADSTAPDPKKIKIIKRHFVRVKGLYKYEDGSQQLKSEEFEIKNVSWREDKNSVNPDDHFLVELELDKHPPILLFLSDRRTVSYLEIDDLRYLMRGY